MEVCLLVYIVLNLFLWCSDEDISIRLLFLHAFFSDSLIFHYQHLSFMSAVMPHSVSPRLSFEAGIDLFVLCLWF